MEALHDRGSYSDCELNALPLNYPAIPSIEITDENILPLFSPKGLARKLNTDTPSRKQDGGRAILFSSLAQICYLCLFHSLSGRISSYLPSALIITVKSGILQQCILLTTWDMWILRRQGTYTVFTTKLQSAKFHKYHKEVTGRLVQWK